MIIFLDIIVNYFYYINKLSLCTFIFILYFCFNTTTNYITFLSQVKRVSGTKITSLLTTRNNPYVKLNK